MAYSTQWLNVVRRPRMRLWKLPAGAHEPLMPWITPQVPPELEALFRAEGQVRQLNGGEYVYTPRMPLSLMSLITQGVAGRTFGSMYSQSKQGMALAVAHRICGGNHTFHSGRPGNGRYFAVTPLEVITLPNARIKERMEECQTLRQAVEVQLECCIQSDRIGLAANSVLPVQDRVRLYFLSWAFAYGKLEMRSGAEWVRLEAVLPQTQVLRVTSSSLIQVKRCYAELKASGDLLSEGSTVFIRAEALDGVWAWLCSSEDITCDYARPKDWRGFLQG